MATLEEQFNSRVSAFLARTGIAPTALGMQALGDPSLLRQVERGRSPSLRTADRVLAFIAAYDSDPGGARDPPPRPRRRRSPPRPGRTEGSRAETERPMKRKTDLPPRVLRCPEVEARTGLSRSTIYRWRVAGRFPQTIPLGKRSVGWIEAEVDAWIRDRTAERRGGGEAAAP